MVLGTVSYSQKRPIYIGLKSHFTGLIIPHRDTLKEIASSTPRGIQVEISRFNISEKSWQSCNCYARTGFSFAIFDYGNQNKLGQSYNLKFFLEPLININSKILLSYRAGMAISYLNRTYNEQTNPENLFYSSPISYMLLLSLNLNYKINDEFNLNTGVFYNHISNGGMRQPNLGMNFPTLSLGVDYIINPQKEKLVKYRKTDSLSKNNFFYFRIPFSIKTVDAMDTTFEEAQKAVSGIELGYQHQFTKLNAVILGMEVLYDGSWKERNERWNSNFDHRTINLLLGHSFVLGRFNFIQQLGFYAYKDFPNTNSRFYQRYALYYNLLDYLHLGFSLKSHLEVAEIMDVRIGVNF